jgi:hypothetical protein
MPLKENRNTSTISGAKAIFQIDSKDVAHASNANFGIVVESQPITCIGDENTKEHCETGITLSLSCTIFRIYNKNAQALGIRPSLMNILLQPTFTVKLKEKLTGNTLRVLEGVKYAGESEAVDARGVMQTQYNFTVLKSYDEADEAAGTTGQNPAIPQGINWNNN